MSFRRYQALLLAVGLTVSALVASAGVAEAAPVVSVTTLPVPPGTTSSFVSDLNARGVSVGRVTVSGVQRAVRWSGAGYTLLATPAANSGSSADLINDLGVIAGTLAIPGLSNVTIRRWLPTGATSDCTPSNATAGVLALNAPGATLNSTVLAPHVFSASVCGTDGVNTATGLGGAYDLANDGRVAGYNLTGSVLDNTLAFVPVVRAADGTVTSLPVPTGKSGVAYGFGPGGTVVGALGTWKISGTIVQVLNFVPQTAVIWQDGQLEQLGTLGGATSKPLTSRRTVSQTGDVIGNSLTSSGQNHAFLWRQGRMIDLGTLGGPASEPAAVNDLGQVVGSSTTASGAVHAFLWSKGRMIDLGAPAGSSSEAVDINNAGQIVGDVSAAGSTDSRAVRWTVRGA